MDIVQPQRAEMRLYDSSHERLYINAAERDRFASAARKSDPAVACFCFTLLYTGCRVSEALALTTASVQVELGIITFRTLKRRRHDVFREVPVPTVLIDHIVHVCDLTDQSVPRPLWSVGGSPLSRTTAYRWVKRVMAEAGITGAKACPKGLRHGYGIHALQAGVQLNMLQKWMGHASMDTTAIYANATGTEELRIAARMWA